MMSLKLLLSIGLGPITATVVSATSDVFDFASFLTDDIIIRDVAVIGGGSSGTYAAINLRELGQSVVVIEKEDVLGGHTNTYTDPSTGVTVDYGLQGFLNSSVTLDYFAHFDIPLTSPGASDAVYRPVDFTTGQDVPISGGTDLTSWAEQLAKYPWIDTTWEVPQPVPADLLLPLGDFITKYNLSASAFDIYLSAQGLSDPLKHLTLNVMKMVDQAFLKEMAGAGLRTERQNNGELYVKARAELGSDALLSSTVTAALRPSSGASLLVVKTPSGYKLVKASKLLITIPPILDNMNPFLLDTKESSLFSQFDYMGYYTILLNNTGLPTGFTYINANAKSTTYNIPTLPGDSQIFETRIPGLFYAWYRSPTDLTQKQVESHTIATIQKIQAAEGIKASTPGIVEFRSHTPYKLTVSADAISKGFYTNLLSLQGHRGTWYTGAAFISHNSGIIWNFTKALLPQIVAA